MKQQLQHATTSFYTSGSMHKNSIAIACAFVLANLMIRSSTAAVADRTLPSNARSTASARKFNVTKKQIRIAYEAGRRALFSCADCCNLAMTPSSLPFKDGTCRR
ncbi:MAG: hypothetical protein R3F19_00340 [Verrucomicrobiales bacterium]